MNCFKYVLMTHFQLDNAKAKPDLKQLGIKVGIQSEFLKTFTEMTPRDLLNREKHRGKRQMSYLHLGRTLTGKN